MKKFINQHYFIFVLLCLAVIAAVYLVSELRLVSVESGSMEPNIPTWSLCLVDTNVPYEEIEVGDVVVYVRASDGKRIIHRVIEITPEGMVTKGDANSIDDGVSTTRDNLFGKTLFHIPWLGRVSALARTPAGFGVIAALVLALVISDFFGSRRKSAEESEE